MKFGSFSFSSQPAAVPEGEVPVPHPPKVLGLRPLIAGQLTSLLAVLALWPNLEHHRPLVLWWLISALGQTFLASMASRIHRRGDSDGQAEDPDLPHYLLSAWALLAGAVWGALPLVGPYNASPEAQFTVFLILGGVTFGGAAILSASRSAYILFVTATLLPLFILTLTSPSSMPRASAGMVVLALFAFVLHDLIRNSLGTVATPPAAGKQSDSAPDALIEHAGEAIIYSHGNRVIHYNRRFAEMVASAPPAGSSRRPLAGWLADRTEWRRRARTATCVLTAGQTYREVVRLRRSDGSPFDAAISGRALNAGSKPLKVVWVASDISERTASEARKTLAAEQLQSLVDLSGDWYWHTDALHRLVRVSSAKSRPEMALEHQIGNHWWQFNRPGAGQRSEQAAVRNAFESRAGFRDLMIEIKDGGNPPRWLTLSGTPRHEEHGRFVGHHGIAIDVTDRVRGSEHIRHLAYHDALTGLPNRRLLTDRLTQAIVRAQRYRERLGIILIDLDDFKRINDISGHAAGDRALQETADRLRSCVRSCDTIARLGGDEFVILLSELDQPSDVDQVAAKVLAAIGEPIAGRPLLTSLGTSIGVAIYPEDAITPDSLLEVADTRMYRAKRRGGRQVESI